MCVIANNNFDNHSTNQLAFKQKLPRYLYHFTSYESANKILNDGFIHATHDGVGLLNEGVFMVDFQNLVKSWTNFFVNDGANKVSLLTCLFGQISKGDDKIACFRIPSKELGFPTIVRSQNDLKKSLDLNINDAPFYSKGDKYKLFQRKGHSIEYVHWGNIKVNKSHLVGVCDLFEASFNLFKNLNYKDFDLKKVNDESVRTLKKLFDNQPEIKAF